MAVSIRNLEQANMLAAEKQGLQRAIEVLEAGRSIDTMTIAGIVIPTREMEYPPQMGQALQGLLTTRIEALDKQLTELGVDTTAPEMPEPEPAHTRPASRRK